MVKISIDPWKDIVFHDVQQLQIRELLHLQAISIELAQAVSPLAWAHGILYNTAPMLESEELGLEQLRGRIHFSSLFFSFMPTYSGSVRSGRIDIPVLDLSSNIIADSISLWIKENYKPMNEQV